MGRRVGLRAEEGVITELGPAVEPRQGDRVIEADGLLLTPPLVNGHTHAAMTLFRGFGDDLPLMEWLRTKIWPAEERLEPDDVYWGTRLAAVEMIRSGTTRFFDMYWHGVEAARAVVEAGMRAVVSSVLIDRLDPAAGEKARPQVLESLDRLTGLGPLVTPSFGPHGDLHGQRRVARLDRRGGGGAAAPCADPPVGDRRRGERVRSPHRQDARPGTSTTSACSAPARPSPTVSGSTPRSSSCSPSAAPRSSPIRPPT